jgi:hypothetical protein
MYDHNENEDVYKACGVSEEVYDETSLKIQEIDMDKSITKTSIKLEAIMQLMTSAERVKCLGMLTLVALLALDSMGSKARFADEFILWSEKHPEAQKALTDFFAENIQAKAIKILGKIDV